MTRQYMPDDDSVVVVIGSGAGGGTVSNELAQQGIDLVCLEAGNRLTLADVGNDTAGMEQKMGWHHKRLSALHGILPIQALPTSVAPRTRRLLARWNCTSTCTGNSTRAEGELVYFGNFLLAPGEWKRVWPYESASLETGSGPALQSFEATDPEGQRPERRRRHGRVRAHMDEGDGQRQPSEHRHAPGHGPLHPVVRRRRRGRDGVRRREISRQQENRGEQQHEDGVAERLVFNRHETVLHVGHVARENHGEYAQVVREHREQPAGGDDDGDAPPTDAVA